MPTPAQFGAVQTLIETAPDSALGSLAMALSAATVGPMAPIRDMVETERMDRGLRNEVLAPIVPLFYARADGVQAPVLPARVLGALWRELKAREPGLVTEAAHAVAELQPEDPSPPVLDTLCEAAAALVRAEPQAIFRAGDHDGALPEALAANLDLAPVARRVVGRLPEWLGKTTDERIASLKVLFRDATAIAVDATPRLLEIVLAHLAEAPPILRLVAILTDRAGDRYLASSELASFGVRLLEDVEARISRIKTFDAHAGAAGARRVAADIVAACSTLAEMEACIDLSRDGPWGQRVTASRKSLAVSVESRLREVESAVTHALPLATVRIAGRMTRPAPKLNADPDPRNVELARGLLVMLAAVRATAGAGGYGALRSAVAEKVTEKVTVYADELLTLVNGGEAPDEDRAQAFLEIAAEFVGYASDERAAAIIRRRAAVAGVRQGSQDIAQAG